MIKVVWSPVNQAWFIMWDDSVLSIQNTKEEALGWLRERDLDLGQ